MDISESSTERARRLERHPLVRFRSGAAGREEPYLADTRLLVRQVVAQLRDEHGDVNAVADYLAIDSLLVRAAQEYYADFGAEVDADAAWARGVEAGEHARWEREQAGTA